MSNIDKRALREAAEKATPGPWRYLKSTPFMDAEISAENHTRVVNLLAGDVTADNSEFIAAANPDVVLALLDELEAKDKAWSAQDNHINQQADRIESLEKKNGELGRALGAAEERIAELEATQGKPVMFIDGDISPADADKLAPVIREFNEETETPAARMARIIRENPHPTNMCDMPAASAGKGE